jgi:hypothetical protein
MDRHTVARHDVDALGMQRSERLVGERVGAAPRPTDDPMLGRQNPRGARPDGTRREGNYSEFSTLAHGAPS